MQDSCPHGILQALAPAADLARAGSKRRDLNELSCLHSYPIFGFEPHYPDGVERCWISNSGSR